MSCNNSPGPWNGWGPFGCHMPPCVPAGVAQESVPSILDNLTATLFGTITKSYVNGRVVWNAPCSSAPIIPGYPPLPGEGVLCYVLRVMGDLGVFPAGAWNSTTSYPANALVGYNGALYYSLVANLDVVPGTNPAVWGLMLTAPTGPEGPPGTPGTANPNLAARTLTTSQSVANTDQLVVLNFASSGYITIPAGSTLYSGQVYWFKLAAGSSTVTINMSGSDTLDGATSYTLDTPGETLNMAQVNQTGVWEVI